MLVCQVRSRREKVASLDHVRSSCRAVCSNNSDLDLPFADYQACFLLVHRVINQAAGRTTSHLSCCGKETPSGGNVDIYFRQGRIVPTLLFIRSVQTHPYATHFKNKNLICPWFYKLFSAGAQTGSPWFVSLIGIWTVDYCETKRILIVFSRLPQQLWHLISELSCFECRNCLHSKQEVTNSFCCLLRISLSVLYFETDHWTETFFL